MIYIIAESGAKGDEKRRNFIPEELLVMRIRRARASEY
jgi:hypothetical protein